MFRIVKVAACGVALIGLLAATPGVAQDYPNKPVKVVVPFPAGGGYSGIER